MKNPENVLDAVAMLKENLSLNSATGDFPNIGLYLGQSQDPKVFEPLIEGLVQGGHYIRAMCAIGLGYLGDKRAVPVLIDKFLNDKGYLVRCDCALALGRLDAEEAIPFFQKVFPNEESDGRMRIIMASKKITSQKATDFLNALEKELTSKDILSKHEEFLLSLIIKETL